MTHYSIIKCCLYLKWIYIMSTLIVIRICFYSFKFIKQNNVQKMHLTRIYIYIYDFFLKVHEIFQSVFGW